MLTEPAYVHNSHPVPHQHAAPSIPPLRIPLATIQPPRTLHLLFFFRNNKRENFHAGGAPALPLGPLHKPMCLKHQAVPWPIYTSLGLLVPCDLHTLSPFHASRLSPSSLCSCIHCSCTLDGSCSSPQHPKLWALTSFIHSSQSTLNFPRFRSFLIGGLWTTFS